MFGTQLEQPVDSLRDMREQGSFAMARELTLFWGSQSFLIMHQIGGGYNVPPTLALEWWDPSTTLAG